MASPHQQDIVWKVLKATVSRGIQNNWKLLVRRVDVAELQLILDLGRVQPDDDNEIIIHKVLDCSVTNS